MPEPPKTYVSSQSHVDTYTDHEQHWPRPRVTTRNQLRVVREDGGYIGFASDVYALTETLWSGRVPQRKRIRGYIVQRASEIYSNFVSLEEIERANAARNTA